jgi:hypothetical protein
MELQNDNLFLKSRVSVICSSLRGKNAATL